MVDCVDPYIECDNKPIGIEQLFRLLVTIDGNGNPALRSCGGGGGGGAALLVGNSLFVSSQGKTILGGAVRESLTDHFSSLVEAVSSAVSGDTIYVYGGTHVVNTNILKDGVKYRFLGKPLLVNAYFWNLGVPMNISIEGDATFQNTGGQYTFDLTIGCVLNGSCYDMTAITGGFFRLTDATVNFKVENRILKTNINSRLFELNGVTNFNLTARFIDYIHLGATGNTTRFVYLFTNYSGVSVINAELIRRTRGYGGVIQVGDAALSSSGSITINSNFDLTYDNLPPLDFAALIWNRNNSDQCIVNINGDIVTNIPIIRYAGDFTGIRPGGITNFQGKIVSNSQANNRPVINSINSLKPIINIVGEIIENGLARDVIKIDALGLDAEINLNGVNVYQNFEDIALVSCVNIVSTNKLLLNNSKFVMADSIGTPECITTDAPTNIKVLQANASSNVAANINITNVIVGTNLIIDNLIE